MITLFQHLELAVLSSNLFVHTIIFTIGARFNGTGYLITFGSINYSTALKRTTRSTKASATVQEEENEVSDKENMKKAKLVAKYPHKTKINESLKYRKTELSESNSTQLTGKNITLEVNRAKSIRSLADYSTFLGSNNVRLSAMY